MRTTPLHGSEAIRNNRNFELLLHHAVEHELLTDNLLENRLQSINTANSIGKTPLHVAAEWGRIEYAQKLIENGASVHFTDQEGRTPLDLATSDAMIELLTANKAVRHCESPRDTFDLLLWGFGKHSNNHQKNISIIYILVMWHFYKTPKITKTNLLFLLH